MPCRVHNELFIHRATPICSIYVENTGEGYKVKELIWGFFTKTGSVSTYLLYKDMDNDGVREQNEGDYETPAHQRGGATLHQL